mmetsp:Transcript_11733/g.49210  ORF Transcript_11733/g.49210 Transcript_11733/m.49210 type:complete len:308 (+) Transcript_11733:1162-2085(+)
MRPGWYRVPYLNIPAGDAHPICAAVCSRQKYRVIAAAPLSRRGFAFKPLALAASTAPSMDRSAIGGGICGASSSSPSCVCVVSESVVPSESVRAGDAPPAGAVLENSSLDTASTTSSRSLRSGVRSSGTAAPTGRPRMFPSAMIASSVAVPSTSPGHGSDASDKSWTSSLEPPDVSSGSTIDAPPLMRHVSAARNPPLGLKQISTSVSRLPLRVIVVGKCAPRNMHTNARDLSRLTGSVSRAVDEPVSSTDSSAVSALGCKPSGAPRTGTALASPVAGSCSSLQISPLNDPKTPSGMRKSPSGPDAS